jgi:hypothetical protein
MRARLYLTALICTLAGSAESFAASPISRSIGEACAFSNQNFQVATSALVGAGWEELDSKEIAAAAARKANVGAFLRNVSQDTSATQALTILENEENALLNRILASSNYAPLSVLKHSEYPNTLLLLLGDENSLECIAVGSSIIQAAQLSSDIRNPMTEKSLRGYRLYDDSVEVLFLAAGGGGQQGEGRTTISLILIDGHTLPEALQGAMESSFALSMRSIR